MKRLALPDPEDELRLAALAEDDALGSFPELRNALATILDSYAIYRNIRGNAKHADCPQALPLLDSLKGALRGHYSSPPVAIRTSINALRKSKSPDVCAMCGSPKAGSLDHV